MLWARGGFLITLSLSVLESYFWFLHPED